MLLERQDLVFYKNKPITLVGEGHVDVGQVAPEFRLSKSVEDDLQSRHLRGKVIVLNVIPSIDTPVCSSQTKRFNDELQTLGTPDVRVIGVSMDLPFAIARWCQTNGVDLVEATSDYKYFEFGKRFGLVMKGLGLLARSVFVLDPAGIVRHVEIVRNMEDEPNYEAALNVVRDCLQSSDTALN